MQKMKTLYKVGTSMKYEGKYVVLFTHYGTGSPKPEVIKKYDPSDHEYTRSYPYEQDI